MAKTKISEYSATSSDNTDISNINIAEGCSPANVNNAIRTLMAQLKDQQSGTSGDNFTIGGNLSVTGTSTLTGNVTAPTQSSSDNSTKVATTAFVTTKVGTLGTMASQNANAVAITGGTITGITDLTVADGGTGASSITANSVILGNGTSTLSGNLVAAGAAGNVLKSNGTTWISGSGSAITSGTVVTTTSGTTADFTGIPSTAKRITVMFSQVSTNGTSPIIVQLGSGSVQTTGYFGFCVNGITSGSVISSGINTSASQDADSLHSGNFAFTLLNGNTWVVSGVMSDRSTNGTYFSGNVTLSGALDRVRITTVNGTDAFDSGSINILYE
jgi:hypothetical protein